MKKKPLLALSLLGLIAVSGCNPHGELVPYLGKWDGKFTVLEAEPNATPNDLDRESLRGYLMLYATKMLFKLHLEGEQETVDIEGTWRLEKGRVFLDTKKTSIDDMGGENFRDPNRKFIPGEAIRATYSKPVTLSLDKTNKKLSGLPITMGKVIGKHEFEKLGLR